MKLTYTLTLAAIAATTLAASAATTIIDSSGESINQANFTAAAGQTFTTGILGSDTKLSTITLAGPQSVGATDPINFGIEISINGAVHSTWSPGTALGEVGPLDSTGGITFDFTSLGIILTDNTVYALRFTDGAGTNASARLGLSNGATGGSGGSAPGAFADGTLFSGGNTVFGDGFDAAISVNTISVPEPSSAALLGLGGLVLILHRRK